MSTTRRALSGHAIQLGYQYLVVTIFAALMVYPLVWLFFAALKDNSEIFGQASLLPSVYKWENFAKGFYVVRGFTILRFFFNTCGLVLGVLVGTLLSSTLAGYGFARMSFRFKKGLFSLLIATMLLPQTVTLMTKYLIFTKLHWINTYLPFWVPSLLGVGIGGAFCIFLTVQFIRGIPKELDDAGRIDGCSSFMILVRLILPLSKALLFSVMIFTFIWTWNDFQNQLIFINSVERYTMALALRISIDSSDYVEWGPKFAFALLSMLPSLIVFFVAQRHFIQGIATEGLRE